MRRFNKHSITDTLIEIASEIEAIEDINSYEQVKGLWREYFKIVLHTFGIKGEPAEILFQWGKFGHNWKDLWLENSIYKFHSPEQLFKEFKSEAMYMLFFQ